jgi:hypothetical protein
MVRIAFKAGWLSAGGKPPQAQKVVELIIPQRTIPIEGHPDFIETDIKLEDE